MVLLVKQVHLQKDVGAGDGQLDGTFGRREVEDLLAAEQRRTKRESMHNRGSSIDRIIMVCIFGY